MPLCKTKNHAVREAHHLRDCDICGQVERIETCGKSFTVREPAGTRNLLCGYFAFSPRVTLKELWNQYRLALQYQPGGGFALVTQFEPPAWFRFEVGQWK
jgi:hypothetical protein